MNRFTAKDLESRVEYTPQFVENSINTIDERIEYHNDIGFNCISLPVEKDLCRIIAKHYIARGFVVEIEKNTSIFVRRYELIIKW